MLKAVKSKQRIVRMPAIAEFTSKPSELISGICNPKREIRERLDGIVEKNVFAKPIKVLDVRHRDQVRPTEVHEFAEPIAHAHVDRLMHGQLNGGPRLFSRRKKNFVLVSDNDRALLWLVFLFYFDTREWDREIAEVQMKLPGACRLFFR